jgi:Mn2+/Fe2+ NRAMP family transporter
MLLGAMFLMSTSAIGPGFITQTTAFTVTLGAAFAFAILVSILVDIAVQLNVWRVIGVSGPARPGARQPRAARPRLRPRGLVVMGGLIFNIGNVGGGGLGLDALLGVEPRHRRRDNGRPSPSRSSSATGPASRWTASSSSWA